MKRKVFTIGYTGFGLNEFVSVLASHRIECLIDVREIPVSRKRGFAKNALKDELGEHGIAYEHFKALGSPRQLRHQVREDRKYSAFFRGVHEHLQQDAGAGALETVLGKCKVMRSCIMCCCPDWAFCHRKCIVEMLEASGMTFEHLNKPDPQRTLWRRAA